MPRLLTFLLALACVAGAGGLGAAEPAVSAPVPAAAAAAGDRPNIVLITTDDQTLMEMRWLPKTRRLIGRHGVTFRRMISTHPNCCPARAQILTGQYAHNNGVHTNRPPNGGHDAFSPRTALPVWLQRAGYSTGFVGKYLHGYNEDDGLEPGWDHWKPIVGRIQDYWGVLQYDDGELRRYADDAYHTHIVARQTRDMVTEFAAEDEPFFLWSAYVAPHGSCEGSRVCAAPPPPEDKYARIHSDVRLPSLAKPSFNERRVKDKPERARRTKRVDPAAMQKLFTARLRVLASLDDAVARTVRALRRADVLDETVIVFTSDNGYLFGEHRLEGKVVAYEESVRVPLLMRGPGLPRGEHRKQTVAMVDLAPTIAGLAEARPMVTVDGRNIWRYASRNARQRDRALLVQAGSYRTPADPPWVYRAVRTDRYTYVRWYAPKGIELYDRRRDPYQLRNAAGQRDLRPVQRRLRRTLRRLQDCAGSDCRVDFR